MASSSILFVDYLFDVFSNKARIVREIKEPFEEYDDGKFRERFRLSKSTVQRLLAEVSSQFACSAEFCALIYFH